MIIFNSGKKIAKKSTAALTFLSKPDINDSYKIPILLHWAGTPYVDSDTREIPIDIYPGIPQRLDILFTQRDHYIAGCWLGTSWALRFNIPQKDFRFYLPPGEYEVEIKIRCESGEGCQKKYRFQSPDRFKSIKNIEEILWYQHWHWE